MRFITLGSSSLANGYLLFNGKEALVIECGVRMSNVKRLLGFDISVINCVLSTHAHRDHSKYVKEYLNAGYLSSGMSS